MKKKLLAAALLLAMCPSAFAQADILAAAIKDVIKDKVEGDIGNLASKAYLAELCTDIYLGKPEKPVENLISNYDAAGLPKDVALKILEYLVPEAAGPVGLLMQMNDAAYQGVEYFQDWAKDTNMAVFKREVVDKAATVEEMDARWRDFQDYYINADRADKGIFYANRADFLREMKAAYAVARKHLAVEIYRREAPARRAEAIEKAVKRLNWIKRDAELKVNGVVSMLKITGTPVTAENIRRALKDNAYNNELVKKWWAEVDKAAAAKDAARLPPSGDPNLDKVTAMMGDAKKQAAAGNTAPDYGPTIREYGLNADRLLTNNVSPSEYRTVRDGLRSAVSSLTEACKAPHIANMYYAGQDERRRLQGLVEACDKTAQAPYKEMEEIDRRFYDYGKKLRADLEALTMGGWKASPLKDLGEKLKAEIYAPPQGQALEKADGVMSSVENNNAYEAHSHWMGYSPSGKTAPPLEQLKKYRDGMAARAALYETLVGQAQDKALQYEKAIKDFEAEFNAAAAKYAALYQQNSSMAELLEIEQYKFASQTRDLEGARAAMNDEYFCLSAPFIEKRRSRGVLARREQQGWDNDIKASETFLANFKTAPATASGLIHSPAAGGPADLTAEGLGKYYSAELAGLVGAIDLSTLFLDEKVRGGDRSQYLYYEGEGIRVTDLPPLVKFSTLKNHSDRAEELRKKIAALKASDLEGRAAKVIEMDTAMEKAYSAISIPPKECAETRQAFTAARSAMGDGLIRCAAASKSVPCLAYAPLEEKVKAYQARIAGAETLEKKCVAACNKAAADPSYDTRPDCSVIRDKWELSTEAGTACGAASAAKWDASKKEFAKYNPFKEAAVAGKPLEWDDIKLTRADLKGGKAEVTGSLTADAPAYSQVYVSLNGDYASPEPGRTVPVSGGRFEFSFTPVPGETYYVGVQALGGPNGMKSMPLPSKGHVKVTLAAEDRTAEAQAFYDKFRAAYEGRNAAAVMALISPDWGAGGDDTSLEDLEENLRSNFRLYDEIRFALTGLKVTQQGAALQACYDTVITSRIFKRNLKHEEKAAVCDELKEEGGRLRIARTLSGRYWYVK